MDFLDSLDLETIDKKSHRVRSWYLYEQYKSLERSQLDAAQKLKDRSYQERILRQELSERKARRKLYDQFGLCQSESRIKKNSKSESTKTSVSASNDDFFESFCDLHEDESVAQVTETEFADDPFSNSGLSASKCCIDDFKSLDDHRDDQSYTGSVNSVVEKMPMCEDIQPPEELEFTAKTIAENLNMQLDAVQKDIKCLEEIAKLDDADDDKIFEDDSLVTVDDRESKQVTVSEKCDQEYNNNMIAIWSRLVSFAYQVVQLNHGNCYCDYSSQFLTAVLACDVLRRGVNRMCNILQPYVSPIKYATDESDKSNESTKNEKEKKSVQSRKCRKISENKESATNALQQYNLLQPLLNKKTRTNKTRCTHRKYSENWQHCTHSFENQPESNKNRRASEPWRSVAKLYTPIDDLSQISSSSSIWPDFLKEKELSKHHCSYCHKAVNPMLKIAQYIDSILKDIDDSKHV